MYRGIWKNELVKEKHPRGYDYFWMVGQFRDTEPDAEDTDEWALNNGYAAITPTTIDVTAYSAMDEIGKMLLK
jgi:5'-nucleotidase